MDHLLKTRENVLTIKPNASNKYVIFSDFHRGVSDYADDFKSPNRLSYTQALSHYFNDDFTLIHLGDVEELKEQFLLGKVVDHKENQPILANERIFYSNNRYLKVFGNHDSQWGNKKRVRKYLHTHFPNIKVYEGILLEYDDAPNVMLVHGHQGYSWFKTNIAEKLALPFYKLGLNILGISRETNYESYCKIEKTEKEFYEWVSDQQDLLLVFGHTHRPLWGSSTHLDKLHDEYEEMRKEISAMAKKNNVTTRVVMKNSATFGVEALVKTMVETVIKMTSKKKESGTCRSTLSLPLLFNTGCCIFEDGDITGIEIEDGELRLIKWGADDDGIIKRSILESEALDSFTIPK